jgi:glycerol-3-phosphate dehydrogenase (NAD(P)+)
MKIVTIIGAGMMGSAMCWPVHDQGCQVRLVGTPLDEEIIRSIQKNCFHPKLEREIPAGITAYPHTGLPEALQGTDLVINGVSSFGVEWFIHSAAPLLQSGVPVLSVTKGLSISAQGQVQTLPDYMLDQLPSHLRGKVSLNAIGGPCIAHELAARRHTGVVFTGHDAAILQSLKEALQTPYYHVWTSTDCLEVEICAALKNGYALAIGMAVGLMDTQGADGLANMYNPQAALFAQSCFEMRRFIQVCGGDERHAAWLPGAGDLYVTVYGGRTLKLGRLLGQGRTFEEARQILAGVTLESVEIITRAAQAVALWQEQGQAGAGEFPLLRFLDQVLRQQAAVIFPWEQFFSAQAPFSF